MTTTTAKPIGRKAYGSIPHLPSSRMGPADHHCQPGQARIATERARDWRDVVIVQEKLDGSCCAVARTGSQITALTRRGYLATSSPFEQHHTFAQWVETNRDRFLALLEDGERVVGEWLAQAHGTRYDLPHESFVPFDIMRGSTRLAHYKVENRVTAVDLVPPRVISIGAPVSVDTVCEVLDPSSHGALDPVEGAMWRVERDGKVDFLVKWVRPDKIDGCYLPERSGCAPIWNWRPSA